MIDSYPALQAASVWTGVLILWLLTLGVVVVRRRRRHRVLFGEGTGEMTTAVRAFGNAAEYIPAGVAALILLALLGMPAVWIHGLGAVLTLGRLIHGWGLLFLKGPSLGRIVGMVLTWLPLLVAALMLIVHGLI